MTTMDKEKEVDYFVFAALYWATNTLRSTCAERKLLRVAQALLVRLPAPGPRPARPQHWPPNWRPITGLGGLFRLLVPMKPTNGLRER